MMNSKIWLRPALWALAVVCGAAALRWFFPVLLPFLVGFLVAWAAEPLAGRLAGGGRISRGVSAGLAITAVYLGLILILYGLGRLALRELDDLSRQLPELVSSMDETVGRTEEWLLRLAGRAPERFRAGLEKSIHDLFNDGSALTQGAAGKLLQMIYQLIGNLPDALVFLGTAITSSFLISARLPGLRPWLREKLPGNASERIIPTLHNLRVNFGGWLRAQLKLMGLTFVLLTAGLLVLRVRYPILLGAVIAVVDAMPILGTGTVLIPWGILELGQGRTALGLGLLGVYGIAALVRSALEPRLVGRQLGLNPLLTLGAVYLGYRFWGIFGMILAPIASVTMMDLWAMGRPGEG